MTTKRLVTVLAILVVGFGAVFWLPAATKNEPLGVRLQLPDEIGIWEGKDEQITQRERDVLASDTEFARKQYRNFAGDTIFASVVLSGKDLDNSIHRPERCLPAQGWTIVDSRPTRLPLPGSGKNGLEVVRLLNVRSVPGLDGKPRAIYHINYYWFVGHNRLTASHLERTFFDIQDRVLHGYNQRWAYVTVAATITEGLQSFGRSEKETDAMIQQFIQKLAPEILLDRPPQYAAQTR